jgi:hypothetical protein
MTLRHFYLGRPTRLSIFFPTLNLLTQGFVVSAGWRRQARLDYHPLNANSTKVEKALTPCA